MTAFSSTDAHHRRCVAGTGADECAGCSQHQSPAWPQHAADELPAMWLHCRLILTAPTVTHRYRIGVMRGRIIANVTEACSDP